MSGDANERDDPKYLDFLFLETLLEICRLADIPENVKGTIEGVIEQRACDLPVGLRREAHLAGVFLFSDIVSDAEG